MVWMILHCLGDCKPRNQAGHFNQRIIDAYTQGRAAFLNRSIMGAAETSPNWLQYQYLLITIISHATGNFKPKVFKYFQIIIPETWCTDYLNLFSSHSCFSIVFHLNIWAEHGYLQVKCLAGGKIKNEGENWDLITAF